MTETTTTESTTAVSTAVQFTQNDIPALLETVNEKIRLLSRADKTEAAITVELPGFGDLSKIDDLSVLIQACANIDGKVEAFKASATKHLPESIKAPEFKIAGHSPKVWINFIESKIAKVAHAKELIKLKTVKDTLESNLSQEMKLANDLKKISKLLNED